MRAGHVDLLRAMLVENLSPLVNSLREFVLTSRILSAVGEEREDEDDMANPPRKPVLLLVVVLVAIVLVLSAVSLSTTHTYTLTWHDAEPDTLVATSNVSVTSRLDYIVFPATPTSSPHPPLAHIPVLPEWCIDAHFALGHTCAPGYFGNELTRGMDRFDMVWTWVNSSDARLQDAMMQARREEGFVLAEEKEPTEDKLYRDHDELRHSFRSVLKHFRAHANSFTLFTSDFPLSHSDAYLQDIVDAYSDASRPDENDADAEDEVDAEFEDGNRRTLSRRVDTLEDTELRLGLKPAWLNPDARDWVDGDVELGLQFQSEVFEGFKGLTMASIYLNDDFYIMADLIPADFYTRAMGPVLRLEPALLIAPSPDPARIIPAGEWGPLFASNALLCARFGWRGRPYAQHVPKALSRTLLAEVAEMWPAEMRRTRAHRFRGMGLGAWGEGGDAYSVFLGVHLGVERWRESLLWSFVVGRIGGDDGQWGEAERESAWAAVGGVDGEAEVRVLLTRRRSTDVGRVKGVMRKAGYAWSERTHYVFSSEDGYPYTFPHLGGAKEEENWPQFSGKHLGRELCVLKLACFVGGSASDVFKRIAFEEAVACGDCIIHALRAQSGEYGLAAFLPPPNRTVVVENATYTQQQVMIPRLPLQREDDFGLVRVLGARGGGVVNVRAWTLRLLERYRFVIGDSGTAFVMIQQPSDVTKHLFGWMARDWWLSLVCVNDDIMKDPARSDALIRQWEAARWPAPAAWER
ncbi:hypothetical protein HWV62_18078 [Athelia sp. TMB]|nr:hypothetical protein HWV62_18078 [Athelia sp. TMB]